MRSKVIWSMTIEIQRRGRWEIRLMNTKKIGMWSSAIGHSATISRKRSGRGTISEIEEEEGSGLRIGDA